MFSAMHTSARAAVDGGATLAERCPQAAKGCGVCKALSACGGEGRSCRGGGLVRERRFEPKEPLFTQGAPARQVLVLRSGHVKLSTTLPDGRLQGLQLATVGSLIGVEALTTGHYSYAAEALTPVETCAVAPRDLLQGLKSDPELAMSVIGGLNRELRRSHALICCLGRMSSTERIASFLLSMFESNEPAVEMPLPLTRTEMAEMLGLTLETVSRVLGRLSRAEIIWLQPNGRRFRLLDPDRLNALCGTAVVSA